MHISVHTHTHIYIMMKSEQQGKKTKKQNISRGEVGDEREHIHISGDSSPICKRYLELMLKGIKSYWNTIESGIKHHTPNTLILQYNFQVFKITVWLTVNFTPCLKNYCKLHYLILMSSDIITFWLQTIDYYMPNLTLGNWTKT